MRDNLFRHKIMHDPRIKRMMWDAARWRAYQRELKQAPERGSYFKPAAAVPFLLLAAGTLISLLIFPPWRMR